MRCAKTIFFLGAKVERESLFFFDRESANHDVRAKTSTRRHGCRASTSPASRKTPPKVFGRRAARKCRLEWSRVSAEDPEASGGRAREARQRGFRPRTFNRPNDKHRSRPKSRAIMPSLGGARRAVAFLIAARRGPGREKVSADLPRLPLRGPNSGAGGNNSLQ